MGNVWYNNLQKKYSSNNNSKILIIFMVVLNLNTFKKIIELLN